MPATRFTGEPEALPDSYGTGRLMLAARDPHWLCAWWDFTDEQQRRFNQLSAIRHLKLRVYFDEVGGAPCAEAEGAEVSTTPR